MEIKVTSSAFQNDGMIPTEYTCDGKGISPPLAWTGQPANTKILALICEDPDAPHRLFTHWVLLNLPPATTRLEAGASHAHNLPKGAIEGTNSAGKVGYFPPCPPSGTHRYIFRVFALDTTLDRGSGIERDQLLDAMKGHILAEGQITGLYSRER